MIPILSLCLVLANGVTAPAPLPADTAIQYTIHTDESGTPQVQTHFFDPTATTLHAVHADGRVTQASWGAERRVLIEIRERPTRDRKSPGSAAEAARQRAQLGRDLAALDARLKTRTKARIKRHYDALFSGVAATVDSAAIAEIRRLPNVKAVYEDVVMRAQLAQSVPLIGASSVSSTYGVNGAGVKVAVLDTGIDYTHADLGGCFGAACKVVSGYDYVNDDNDPRDDNGHGTHVAGIIAANGAIKGVAPGATLLAYKVLNSFGWGDSSDVIAALEQAVLDGADIANLSLGSAGGDPDDPVSQAVDNATAAGMLSVVAAGNFGAEQTIESPGVARTALTVGSTDKSWQMATFNSGRGYVFDGDGYLMKPEMVAPGQDIRSTVPTTGPYGDPSGYKSLSGTSMATPHVAGSAALLLQWNGAQTPEELKNRLVTSARNVSGDVFTKGAGGIDLVAAFGVRMLASATHVSFDVISDPSGVVIRERTFSIRNTGTTADTLSLAAESTLPAGATLEIIPSSLTLQAGQSADVLVRLSVNTALLPEPPASMTWSTNIVNTGTTQSVRLPAYFLRGSVLTLSFDEPPADVFLIGEDGWAREYLTAGVTKTVVVKAGLWDVVALYVEPRTIVVHEQQNLEHDLSLDINRAQANRTLTLHAIDDTGQPLPESTFGRRVQLQLGQFTLGVSGSGALHVSDLSPRIPIGVTGKGPDVSGQKFFISSWVGEGLSSDVTLPRTGVPFRRLTVGAAQPAGTAPTSLVTYTGFLVKMPWGLRGIADGGIGPGPLSRTLYLQTFTSEESIVPLVSTGVSTFDWPFTNILAGAYLHQKDEMTVEVSPFWDLHLSDPPMEPEAVLDPTIVRWDLDTAPNSLPLLVRKSSSGFRMYGIGTAPGWTTHTVSKINRVSGAEPTFDLYRNGAFTGTHTFRNANIAGIAVPTGPLEVRSTSAYTIGGVSGSSTASISFNTTKSDADPPELSRFRIEQNGVRTPTPFAPAGDATPKVKFRITDAAVVTVALEWRTNGTVMWTPLVLTNAGADYEAALEQAGAIDLRLTATDASGNTFREEWTPAVITTTPPPPAAPDFITATSSAASQISLSWAAVSSPLGIAGYRIERLPDNTTFTTTGTVTTFVDTNGLVLGNAYFYRVSAVDTNDQSSPPSPYDVATLIDFHDDPALAGVTPIRGMHIADLRRAIDAIRYAAGLPPAFANYDAPTGFVRASDFTALRDGLNEARAVRQLSPVQFGDTVAPGAPIRANSVQTLRNGAK